MINHKNLDEKNRKVYKKKQVIRQIYKDYYALILSQIMDDERHPILEIGSGGGNIKEVIPQCVTSDQFKDDKIDLIENIYNLSFKNESVSNIVFLDVFHHLEFPALALKEINRVLIKNGRIIMIEPGMGVIPKIIYKIFHVEPLGLKKKINWVEIPNSIPGSNDYFAAQSVPWRAFVKKEIDLNDKFKIKLIKPFSDFSYLCSGGYSYPSFYPFFLYRFMKKIDSILSSISLKIFSARMLVVLEKK
jgi:SAM-dependent methyltransferase